MKRKLFGNFFNALLPLSRDKVPTAIISSGGMVEGKLKAE
jgi:hypothetical protein